MNRNKIFRIDYYLIIVTIILSFTKIYANDSIDLQKLKPNILSSQKNEIFLFWEFKQDISIWSKYSTPLTALEMYKDSLRLKLGDTKLNSIVEKQATQNEIYKAFPSTGDDYNFAIIHCGNVGRINPINNIEAQILNYQISRFPLLSVPTEFHAFILINETTNNIRIYFAADDKPFPPKPNIILDEIEKDLKIGWKLKCHLHNHYEPKSNNYIGIMAPSTADAEYYSFLKEDFGLENALITNGFNTLILHNSDFQYFRIKR